MASPRGEWVGPDPPPPPPTSVQTPPEICANPLRRVSCIGGPMHVFCNFLLLTSNNKKFGPPTFFGLATPLPYSWDSFEQPTGDHIGCCRLVAPTRTKGNPGSSGRQQGSREHHHAVRQSVYGQEDATPRCTMYEPESHDI